MRKRCISRPNEKLRGVKRRIEALERWPDEFDSWFPTDVGLGYWNCKLPVLDRLVSQRFSTDSIQIRAVKSLLRAGENIRNARPAHLADSIVVVVVTFPDMFDSEVCVFFDRNHYSRFISRNSTDQKLVPTTKDSLCKRMGFGIPAGFSEAGYDFEFVNDDDDWEYSQWWIYTDGSQLEI